MVSGRHPIRTVPKPWGHETIWAHTDHYVGKILHIKAGHSLSLQYHNHKDETIHLLSGELIYRVQIDEELRRVQRLDGLAEKGIHEEISDTGDAVILRTAGRTTMG